MPFRILLVDDCEPWCRFVCSMVQKAPELQIICEVSDGLAAVHMAKALKPDLILLDIGLPKLNGLEAVRRMRQLSPESKILFLSQESSADVVQEALRTGALGYVVKAHAQADLLTAVEAVIRHERFVSSSIEGYELTEALGALSGQPACKLDNEFTDIDCTPSSKVL